MQAGGRAGRDDFRGVHSFIAEPVVAIGVGIDEVSNRSGLRLRLESGQHRFGLVEVPQSIDEQGCAVAADQPGVAFTPTSIRCQPRGYALANRMKAAWKTCGLARKGGSCVSKCSSEPK